MANVPPDISLNDMLDGVPMPSFSFIDMLNDTSSSLNLNIPVQDLLNPENDEVQRERHKKMAKRSMPYFLNFHLPVTETQPTIAGIHLTERNAIGFTLRMLSGYHTFSLQYQ